MEEYISKSALVAEIKKRFDEYTISILKHYDACKEAKVQELDKILTILDTLEVKEIDTEQLNKLLNWWKEVTTDYSAYKVKEVDLDFQRFAKEMDAIFVLPSSETKNTEENPLNWEYAIAKHFFELGLKAKNK